ncbi:MAG TPA: M20/M25/M40 family metallo-hydrolase [Gemmatimonadaceae bacterium]|jgi:putative aminopeptidase FrvX|nr:M20/M25/M40 family metallo-hydrolase [Gemmatimonadaceae bacterium]
MVEMTSRRALLLFAAQTLLGPLAIRAQATSQISSAITAWIALDATPGRERTIGERLTRELGAGWTSDVWGNVIRRVGSGAPRRVVACALDVPGMVVSQITEAGYIRLHRSGNVPTHPLWDQFHEAQRIAVLTKDGRVPGVVAVANGHFARQHRGDTTVVNVDQLWVDVGASSRQGVQALGISLLDPVIPDRPAWTYEGNAAGPAAGARASCAAVAAVAAAAAARPPAGETIFVLSQQRSFGGVGLASVLARVGTVNALTVADAGRSDAADVVIARSRAPNGVQRTLALDSVRLIVPRVRFAGTFVESIHETDARALLASVSRAAGVSPSADATWPAPSMDTTRVLTPRSDQYEAIERQFFALADLPGVPGHEWRVRNAIKAALPPWARDRAVVDSAGNLIVSAGPDRDSVLFMAHMDEVAFEVERILPDGQVTLGRRGGVVIHAWEGQPAYLHFDPDASGRAAEPLRGAFVPRDSARVKSPTNLNAWFGLDSAQLVARGVRPGLGVTAYKRGARLAGTRVTARSSDDRTGSTALLSAIQQVDPSRFNRKVIFAWSVREEGGLNGARAFAAEHGRALQRVYSIDTFVSSDTPLESPHFAYAPLGAGAVFRGLDDGAIAPASERERIEKLARASNIPVQIGTTHGATDGSAIAFLGAPNTSLSWPGRYSHSPGEVLDLRDVQALARLIVAIAMER